jgi:hypothetical protein
MSARVALMTNTLCYPEGGGHMWVYLNWALGLRAAGCEVTWLEGIAGNASTDELRAGVDALKARLAPFGLDSSVALCSRDGNALDPRVLEGSMDLDAAAESDLLLDLGYLNSPDVVRRFRRSALVDIDPGRLQLWMSEGALPLPRHDAYFTIAESIGRGVPDLGLDWHQAAPCVALDWWDEHEADADAPFTTVSHWRAHEWMEEGGEVYANDKRAGFLPFLDLPRQTDVGLELALCLADDEDDERRLLERRGWSVRHAWTVASTAPGYRDYIQRSRGEFSCAKPSSVRLNQGWLSDRTVCYLASGKPAVIQHTGSSSLAGEGREGLLRFRTVEEAASQLEDVAADYDRHSRAARALAEEHFDAARVAGGVVEKALA